MTAVFYIAAIIAIVATFMAITRVNAMHGLLYLVVSLLALAVDFYALGAPFVAALEIIIYAGAIVVLFIFVVMLLNQGLATMKIERSWLGPRVWLGPAILALVLAGELAYAVSVAPSSRAGARMVGPVEVGLSLYGPYLLGIELASFLLLVGLVGAYHLGRRIGEKSETNHGEHSVELRLDSGSDLVRAGPERSPRPT